MKELQARYLEEIDQEEHRLRARLAETERELDKTDPRESPPYRYERQKLNREKARIFKWMEGKNPMQSVVKGSLNRGYFSLRKEEKEEYQMKKQVLRMLKVLDKAGGPIW